METREVLQSSRKTTVLLVCATPKEVAPDGFYNSAVTKRVMCPRIMVKMGSHLTKKVSLCDFTGNVFVQCENLVHCVFTMHRRNREDFTQHKSSTIGVIYSQRKTSETPFWMPFSVSNF